MGDLIQIAAVFCLAIIMIEGVSISVDINKIEELVFKSKLKRHG